MRESSNEEFKKKGLFLKAYFCILCLLAYSQHITYANDDFDKNWKIIRESSNSILLKAKNVGQVFASVYISEGKEDANLYKKKSHLEDIFKNKKKMLEQTGVFNWKVEKHSFMKSGENIKGLFFEGKYIDNRGTEISFFEFHQFTEESTIQILFTQPSSIKLNKDLKDDLLQKYRVIL